MLRVAFALPRVFAKPSMSAWADRGRAGLAALYVTIQGLGRRTMYGTYKSKTWGDLASSVRCVCGIRFMLHKRTSRADQLTAIGPSELDCKREAGPEHCYPGQP
jgi:hypothetical protein